MGRGHQSSVGNILQQVQRKIRSWLLEDKYSVEDRTLEGITWAMAAFESGDSGFAFGVGQDAGATHCLYIKATFPFGEYQAKLDRMDGVERNEFFWDMRFRLLSMNPEFSFVKEPDEGVLLSKQIFIEGMTREIFWRGVFEIRKGLLAVMWSLERKFSQATPIEDWGYKISGPVH